MFRSVMSCAETSDRHFASHEAILSTSRIQSSLYVTFDVCIRLSVYTCFFPVNIHVYIYMMYVKIEDYYVYIYIYIYMQDKSVRSSVRVSHLLISYALLL